MQVHAIGDLHLSLGAPKAMDVFGPHWENHFERIAADWKERVAPDDLVLVPGDISWATRLGEARADLDAIGALPGRKILLRGNHDYWWSSPAKVRSVLSGNTEILQNNALEVDGLVICGARGWTFPMGRPLSADDTKIFEREKIRLRLSLDAAARLAGGRPLIAMMHFPPLFENWPQTDFTRILEEYGVRDVVFGHLHGEILRQVRLTDYMCRGIRYNLVSADYLGFRLHTIC